MFRRTQNVIGGVTCAQLTCAVLLGITLKATDVSAQGSDVPQAVSPIDAPQAPSGPQAAAPSAPSAASAPGSAEREPAVTATPAAPPAPIALEAPAPPGASGGVSLQSVTLFPANADVRLAFTAEFGAFAVASHTIKFGRDGTTLDYVADGGQDNLFPFLRATGELHLVNRHAIVLLYQPLTVETDVILDDDLRVYDEVFPASAPLELKYGFDFVRASYLYDFLDAPDQELAIGGSLQLRDAVIDFARRDGSQLVSNRNVGPVPALKVRGRYTDDSGWFIGAEVDGIYAGLPVINGAEFPFEGALLDASVRAGVPLVGFANTFVNLRFLGGGARGTEQRASREGDGVTNNWLATVALTLGFEVR